MARIALASAVVAAALAESIWDWGGAGWIAAVILALWLTSVVWGRRHLPNRMAWCSAAMLAAAVVFAVVGLHTDAETCGDFAFLWLLCALILQTRRLREEQ